MREAQAMARLSHPNVLTVYDVLSGEDGVVLAMELAPGGTLRAWLRRTPRAVAEISSVFAQAGRGLAAAHDAGIVHRDFKPSNVMLAADGRVLVGDFGLASFVERETCSTAATTMASDTLAADRETLTDSDLALGTPAYMAPEQLSGGEVSPQSDQFAFCVSLYEALYGKRPFVGSSLEELQRNILSGRITPVPVTGRVPGWLRRAVLRGLRPDPAARHPSMHSLVSLLARDRTRGRRQRLIAAAAVLIAGLAALPSACQLGLMR
jgi:serine/threonine protein kinase